MALLTTLMLVAVMAALAVGVLDDVRFGVRRTANANGVGQAQWYALGAEQLARVRIKQMQAMPGRTTLAGGWNGRPFVFPIEGGSIQGRIEDGQSCFDLNSLGTGAFESKVASPIAVKQFASLLAAVGVPLRDAEGLGQAAADWIDDDSQQVGAYSGEDDVYARLPRPYRTGANLMAEVSELRAVRGFAPEIYARVQPFICALPEDLRDFDDLSRINVNTLTEADAPLFTALTSGIVPASEARQWIARRPPEGWASATEAFAHPLLADNPLPPPVLETATESLRTRFFTLHAEVDYNGSEVVMSSLFEVDSRSGEVLLRARRWTAEE